MEGTSQPPRRALAIDLSSRGFGFVVLEGPTTAADWGTRKVNGEKQAGTILKVASLITLYRPDVLVVEDAAHIRSRRCQRIRSLVAEVVLLGSVHRIRVASISVVMVRRVFAAENAATKHQIAGIVAERLPDLAPLRPPPRKPWMREDDRMAMFDAAAFAMAYYNSYQRRYTKKTD